MRAALTAALMGGVLAACSDSPSEPDGGITVDLTGTTSAPQRVDNGDGVQVLQCTIDLAAVARGKAKATAQWTGSTVRFYVGGDRTTPVDSASLTQQEMQAAWTTPEIIVGQTVETELVIQAPVPFAFSLDVGYTSPGSSKPRTARYDGSCGAGPANAPAPSVTNVTVTPGDGETQPGALLSVQYSFTAPAGLWEATVALGGAAVATVTEQGNFETSGTRTVIVPVPRGVTLGSRATVTVQVTDGAFRQAQSAPVSTPVLVDHIAPELLGASTRPTFTFTPADLSGSWAVGDTVTLRATADDNNAVAWVVWELGAPANVRDSVPPNPVRGSPTTVKFVVRPEWVGTPQLSVWATDRSGNVSPVLRSLPDSIRFLPAGMRAARTADLRQADGKGVVGDPSLVHARAEDAHASSLSRRPAFAIRVH